MKPVLVLRPQPGATATLQRARGLGMPARLLPLFEIEPLVWAAPAADAFDGLLVSSANALRQAGHQLEALRSLPVYAVGESTAKSARELGFDVALCGDGGVDRLLALAAPNLRLLHLCGEDFRPAVRPQQKITAVPVYRARETAIDLEGMKGSIALIHSPRAGARLAALVKFEDRQEICIAAISAAALAAAGEGWADSECAETPSDEALLALAARLCNKTAAQ